MVMTADAKYLRSSYFGIVTAASEGNIIKPFNARSFSSQNLQLIIGGNETYYFSKRCITFRDLAIQMQSNYWLPVFKLRQQMVQKWNCDVNPIIPFNSILLIVSIAAMLLTSTNSWF